MRGGGGSERDVETSFQSSKSLNKLSKEEFHNCLSMCIQKCKCIIVTRMRAAKKGH